MPFDVRTTADGLDLVLAGRLGVQQATPLWDALQPAMSGDAAIRLRAGDLEELDTSIAQILCRLSARTGRLRVGETSDGFLDSLKRRGLERFFAPEASGAVAAVSAAVESSAPESAPQPPAETSAPKAKTASRRKRQTHG
jgi:ABC-type transporter Mla MlaB component